MKQVLCNRILSLKSKRQHQPLVVKNGCPAYIKQNFRQLVWRIPDNDDEQCKVFSKWQQPNVMLGDLRRYLRCPNTVLCNPEIAIDLSADEDGSKETIAAWLRDKFKYEDFISNGMTLIEPYDEYDIQDRPSDKNNKAAIMDPTQRNDETTKTDPNKTNDERTNQEQVRVELGDDFRPSDKNNEAAIMDPMQRNDETSKTDRNKTNDERTNQEQVRVEWGDDDLKPLGEVLLNPSKRKREDGSASLSSNDSDLSSESSMTLDEDETGSMESIDPKLVKTQKEVMYYHGNRDISSIYPFHQRDREMAMAVVNKLQGLPNSMTAYKFHLSKSRTDNVAQQASNIDKMREMYDRFQPHRHVEAQLWMVDSITELQYLVPNEGDKKHGVFIAKIKHGLGKVQISRDWVKKHFKPDVYHSVMNRALSSEDFVPVKSKSGQPVVIGVDLRQVQKVRYVPRNPFRRKEVEPKYEGLLQGDEIIPLDHHFIVANFGNHFVHELVEKSRKKRKFFHVPPGAPTTTVDNKMMNPLYPPVTYRQHGNATCLFASVASALHFLGLERNAMAVADAAHFNSATSAGATEMWFNLLQLLKKECPWLEHRKKQVNHFNILEDVSVYPTVAQLQALDGGCQHAVTIVGRFVFDSNCPRALPLSVETLNYCCSSDDRTSAFDKVYHCYRLEENVNTRPKNSKMARLLAKKSKEELQLLFGIIN
jgi:hypothetical protein